MRGVVAFCCLVWIGTVTPVAGCVCVGGTEWVPKPPAFVGQIAYLDSLGGDPTAFLLVERAWGTEVRDPVLVSTDPSSCGVLFPSEGERYVVFRRADSPEPIRVGSCSSAGGLGEYEDELASLGEPDFTRVITPAVLARHRAAIEEELASIRSCEEKERIEVSHSLKTAGGPAIVPLWPADERQDSYVIGDLTWIPSSSRGGGPVVFARIRNLADCWLDACLWSQRPDGREETLGNGKTRHCSWLPPGPDLYKLLIRLPLREDPSLERSVSLSFEPRDFRPAEE